MPKVQRSREEIDVVRETIMNHALDLIVTEGYEGFSMRKLGTRLSIAAKTIYNYFHSQDDLYLHLLIKGFGQLLDSFHEACAPWDTPEKRLAAIIRTYTDFGLTRANVYNLMFTWHVPKYNDYIGTPVEKTAEKQLAGALECADFFMNALGDCLNHPPDTGTQELLRQEFIFIWSQMHGYIAGINNTLLQYMHGSPLTLKEELITSTLENTRRRLEIINRRAVVKPVPGKSDPPETNPS